MTIGTPKEIKTEEYRVGILPDQVSSLTRKGHKVLVESKAGAGVGLADADYAKAGAEIVSRPEDLWQKSELIVKVKEPLPAEYGLLQPGQIVFTFFHFAADESMTRILIEKKANCVAYELVEEDGTLPILMPMSEIAGRLAPQQAAKYLEKAHGGKGVLLSGATGVEPGKVVVIGGGVVGFNAAEIACGLGARVVVLDKDPERVKSLKKLLPGDCQVILSSREEIIKATKDADAIIGAVLIAGARAPVLVRKEDLKNLEPGTVLVDVAIDQGGCFETSKPTTHRDPVYTVEGIIHYCVANMPGIVPRTSTYALTRASAPYLHLLADKGLKAAEENQPLKKGLALREGAILNQSVAEALHNLN